MAVGQFTTFQEDLLIALANTAQDSIGEYLRPKDIANEAELKYRTGWVTEAVDTLAKQGFLQASFFLGSEPDDCNARVTGAGLEEAERISEERRGRTGEPQCIELEQCSPEYLAVRNAVKATLCAVQGSNEYATTEPEDYQQRLAELDAGSRLLQAPRVRLEAIRSVLISGLRYLAGKFADNAIGIAATAAFTALAALLGLHF